MIDVQSRIERLQAVLRDLEWSADGRYSFGMFAHDYVRMPACPCCKNLKLRGHTVDCTLAAALHEGEK